MTQPMSLTSFVVSTLLMTVVMIAAIGVALWLIEPLSQEAAIRGGLIAWVVMFSMRLAQWAVTRKKTAGPV